MSQIVAGGRKEDMSKTVSACHHGADSLFRKSDIKHTNECVESFRGEALSTWEVREGHRETDVSFETWKDNYEFLRQMVRGERRKPSG